MKWLAFLISGTIAAAAPAQTPSTEQDEGILRKFHIPADDAGLLSFFRERTLDPEQVAALKVKLRQLGSPTFSVRTHAAAELVKAGLNAKALLLDAMKNPATDLEVARRAELCLRQIGDGQEIALAQAAARLLAQHKPPDAAATLIAYVPFAGDPQILPVVQDALNVLAMRDGASWRVMIQAVRDPHPAKRSAAAVALVKAGGLANKSVVQELLKDSSIKVRLPVAIALVEAKDKDAVPFLIDRLADAPADQSWQVVEMLEQLAGDKAPAVYFGPKTPPAQVRDAWRQWWTTNARAVDLAKLADSAPHEGYRLITMMGDRKGTGGGKVVELRPDGSVHWEIENLTYPVDARVVGPNKVLIAEYMGRRVSERDFQGNILWETAVEMPIACQRLPGGATFIASRKQMIVLDADKKTTFTAFSPIGTVSAAQRLRDGSTVVIASTGQCYWLDPDGNATKSFQVGYVYALGGNVEVLPNRHVLVPLYRDGKIAEFDGDGKIVWSVSLPTPISATRLPNGHILASSLGNQRVVELDRDGQTVWSHPVEGRAWRVRGR